MSRLLLIYHQTENDVKLELHRGLRNSLFAQKLSGLILLPEEKQSCIHDSGHVGLPKEFSSVCGIS